MIGVWLRATLFNVAFYGFTALYCLSVTPLAFAPKRVALSIARGFTNGVYWIEKHILGLDYELRGLEYLPKDGPYLIAAKHQSAYETMKLHRLFDDPAIILKKELLRIPVWGWFLGRLDIIAINRTDREGAMSSVISGGLRMKAQGRAIVIFPQGTRTRVDASPVDKPYKGGIIKMYNATGLPIIPMALNSGMFWGRKSFLKRPGTVIFEFLPPIEPGLPDKKVMKALEERLEEASNRLMEEAKEKNPLLRHIKTSAIPL